MFAAWELRCDRRSVLEVVSCAGCAIAHASPELKQARHAVEPTWGCVGSSKMEGFCYRNFHRTEMKIEMNQIGNSEETLLSSFLF
jgi:hypothetical protein